MHFSLADYVLDVVENAIASGASLVELGLEERDGRLTLVVTDNGRGMSEEELQRALDPFYSDGTKHPGRRVGLGLPFLGQLAEALGGSFDVDTRPGVGTRVSLSYGAAHVDAPPEGDVVQTLAQILSYEGEHELQIRRVVGDQSYDVSRSDLIDALGELESVASRSALRDFLESNEEALGSP